MSKLHELLAVEGQLENQANKVRTDLMNTFEKKVHLFRESRVVFKPSVEGEHETVEVQSDIQSTVRKELDWISGHIVKALDASYQVAEANTHARADVVLDDDVQTVILKDVPATALLELEKRVAELQALVAAIPTLDPAKGFTADPQRLNAFKAREVVKTRTKKTIEVIVKYAATKEHPAQTEMINVDKPIGELREQEWSGLITPAEKAELIDRAEMIGRAVRKARARANEAEIDSAKKVGKKIVGFIFNGDK
jgi:hypothetical protein